MGSPSALALSKASVARRHIRNDAKPSGEACGGRGEGGQEHVMCGKPQAESWVMGDAAVEDLAIHLYTAVRMTRVEKKTKMCKIECFKVAELNPVLD